jgi:hypothetical protein
MCVREINKTSQKARNESANPACSFTHRVVSACGVSPGGVSTSTPGVRIAAAVCASVPWNGRGSGGAGGLGGGGSSLRLSSRKCSGRSPGGGSGVGSCMPRWNNSCRRAVAIQVAFEKANFETRISLNRLEG